MTIYCGSKEYESEISSVKEIISFFDGLKEKPLYFNYISLNISFWGQDNPDRTIEEEYIYELLAFELVEGVNTIAWNTTFGPQTFMRLPDGRSVIKPDYLEISNEAIGYWEQRIQEVSNPVIRLQYIGLVYTFKEKITGQGISNDLQKVYVDTILDASINECETPLKSVSYHLPIAFDLASKLNYRFQDVKSEYLKLTKSAKDTHTRVWMAYFCVMLENITDKRLFSAAEKEELVKNIESRLDELMKKDPNATGENMLNPFDIKDVALKLAEYYKKTNKKADKERVLGYIETAFRNILPNASYGQDLLWLEEVQRCYSKFDMDQQAKALYPEIQQAGMRLKSLSETIEKTYTIPTDTIQRLIAEIITGNEDSVFDNFIQKLTPKHKAAADFVDRQSSDPLEGFMGTQLLSESGMPLSTIGTPSRDHEGNEFQFCTKLIELEEPVMRMVILALKENGYFSRDMLVNHIMKSGLINQDRIDIIRKGVEFYLGDDGIVACHLLIPQIEHAICSLVLKTGGQAIRRQPGKDGYMVQLMDKLFSSPVIINVLGDDAVFYLRTLLTEQRGLNLRNMLCHGLINPNYFNINKADRIIHALLLLGNLRIED